MSSQYRLRHSPRSSHQQIKQILMSMNVSPILDVGAAEGLIGQTLQGSGLTIDAVEPMADWAEAAKPYYRTVHNCTAEQIPDLSERYRAVVFADVLEHLVDPVSVICQTRRLVTDDARWIISLPNFAHLAVRLTVLAGKFPQMDSGIFDRTHLHCYTRDSARQMLESAGLRVESVSATPVPITALAKSAAARAVTKIVDPIQTVALSVLPRLFAMQWIFVARNA